MEDFDDLLSCVLFEFWITLAWAWLEVFVVDLLVGLRDVWVRARGDANDLLVAILREVDVSEEDIEGSIVKDHDKLVGILPLVHGLEPPHMVNFSLLFDCWKIIILHNDTIISQNGIIAENSTSSRPK